MNTRKFVTVLAVLLLAYSAFGLLCGGSDVRAMANGEEPLFLSRQASAWSTDGWNERESSGRYDPSENQPASKAPMRLARRSAASAPATGERNVGEGRETAWGDIVRRVLPWIAGLFGLSGLALVACGMFNRGRLVPNQTARSAANAYGGAAGWVSKSEPQTVLAFRLVRTPPPQPMVLPASRDHEETIELRRAA